MEKSYDESGLSADRVEDEALFTREVVKDDVDLMLVDCLLREALTQK